MVLALAAAAAPLSQMTVGNWAALAPAAESTGQATLDIPWQVWAITLGVIAALFVVDLVISGRNPHAVGFREAVAWSVFYISVAVVFGILFGAWAGSPYGAEFFAGYIVEKTLSIDNLFVFVIIMSSFAVPARYRANLLTLGIALALVLRAIFIAVGATLLNYFSFMFLVFGVILIYTGIKLFQHRDEDPDVDDNALVRYTKKTMPVTPDYRGGHYFVKEAGRRHATPLFIAFVAIASTDILFALLGLRALFFLVDGLLDRLVYLSSGLATILVFIGIKLTLHWAHGIWPGVPQISITTSLAVIAVVLVVTTVASLIKVRRDPGLHAHAGSLTGNVEHDHPGHVGPTEPEEA